MLYSSDERMRGAMQWVTALGASSSLLIPIIVLYFIRTQWAWLLCIILFTLLFSSLIGLFTRARSAEIFAATAA
jgi:hypothetical protein